jgi:inner membrane protein
VVLVLLYSYVFTILQLQDYSLLLGSVGLFATLAVVMYYSRKFQW